MYYIIVYSMFILDVDVKGNGYQMKIEILSNN